ncbi:MAG: TonB-dependent receptor [Paludibacter sp.]|jgi:hypothetical protein|nr:TonB-dependent receptor [Paludibacter sp.]
MKPLKALILIILFLTTALLNAQVPDQSVTVTRDYQPAIQDAGKILTTPNVVENQKEKLSANYEDKTFPLPLELNIQPLAAAKAHITNTEKPNDAYLRLGLGNYFNNLLDFALPIVKTEDLNIDFSINHFATFGKKIHSDSKANLNIDKNFDKFTIFGGVGGGFEYFNYYGNFFDTLANKIGIDTSVIANNYFDTDKQKLTHFNIYAGVRSLPYAEGWRYDGEFRFNLLNAAQGVSEKTFTVPLMLSWVRKDDFRVGIDAKFQYLNYNVSDSALTGAFRSYAVLTASPFFIIERERWNAKAGVTTSFSFGRGRWISVAPDANIEFFAAPKFLSLYAVAGGGLKVNTLNDVYAENRYLLPNIQLADTYTPFDIAAGFKLKPIAGLLVDAYVEYRYTHNQYFYKNAVADSAFFSNRFDVDYSKSSLLKAGARLNYDYRNRFNLQAKFAYNAWTAYDIDKAWHLPKIEADIYTSLKITDDLSITASAFYRGERDAKIGDNTLKLKAITDVNVGASYSYSTLLSFFIKANNILNAQYQELNGYDEQRLNFLLGAVVSF